MRKPAKPNPWTTPIGQPTRDTARQVKPRNSSAWTAALPVVKVQQPTKEK